ncbi:MAG: Ig-like domain-containing protein [Candidatus Pristimantibacillus sp.]
MSRKRNRISILLTIALLMQLSLPGWLTLSEPIHAATLGPVIVSKSPADDFTSVGLNSTLSFTFDESVVKVNGSAAITIYDYTLNQVFESYLVSSDGRVAIDGTGRTVTIRPSKAFVENREYYVLIEPGAFANVSNGANFSGIADASQWNFKTIVQIDNVPPGLLGVAPVSEARDVPITSPISLVFNEDVYSSSGDLSLTSDPSSTAYDQRKIAVTSNQVTGSGSNTIIITPSVALYPNTTYTFSIPNGVMKDRAGNSYPGTSWRFTTAPAPVNATSYNPIDNATSVSVASTLTIMFDKEVAAGTTPGTLKYIHLIRSYDNYDEKILPNDTSKVSIVGNTVTIKPQKMLANTKYYVLIDPGALVEKNTGEWFQGISNASTWDFTTDPGDEKDPPLLAAISPVHNGVTSQLNTNLVMTFNEPVYPDAGNIEIRNVVNNVLFRSIPVTSDNISGGGTQTITINPNKALFAGDSNKAFVNNSQYYVTIGNRALRDAAGNYYVGIGANSWTFRVTQDAIKPTLVSTAPTNNTTNVLTNAYYVAEFSETVVKGPGSIWIKPTDSKTAQPVKADYYIQQENSKLAIITLPAGVVLEGNTNYYIEISPDAIVDLAGNAFDGIQNQYQWAFKTIGVDTTPPRVSKLDYNGNVITMTFDEDLNAYGVPAVSTFYITVNGAQRPVTAVAVSGKTVKVTLSSAIVNGQIVKLSYSKPSNTGGIQDLLGNQALSISNSDVTPIVDVTAPTIVSGTISGSTIYLTFNKDLAAANSNAYQQFGISISNNYYSPTSIYVSGKVVQLTFNGTLTSQQAVYVSYSPSSYPLKDSTNTTNVAGFSNFNITGSGVDLTAPSILSAFSNGSTITLTYNETLGAYTIPSISHYSIVVNNNYRSVSQVSISGDKVILTLSSPIASSDTVYVNYTASTPRLTDLAGNAAVSFSSLSAPYGTGATGSGSLAGAIVKGATLTLTFNESLNSSYIPSISQFFVKGQSSSSQVKKVSISGSVATLTLDSPVTIGDTVTLTYYSQSNGLRTNSGKTIDSFSNMKIANQTTLYDSLSGDLEEADGGGVGVKTSAATSVSTTSPAGTYTTKYSISADKLSTAYSAAGSAGLTKARVVFKVPSSEKAAVVAVPLSALQSASYYGKNASFAVQYNGATYEIPVAALNYSELARSLGASGIVGDLLIEIDQGTTSLTSSLTSAISRAKASILAGPVNFEASVTYGDMKKKITGFSGYVSRSMESSLTIDAKNSAVVWYDPETGALSYVPTTFSTSGGKNLATFKRKGNSAYALVRGSVSFTDIGKHWAGTTIQMLANKYIVEGRTSTKFEPQKSITRGEFASYIAKGLGLTGNKSAASKFKDVNSSTVMGAYIGAASEAGIVMGNTDGTFKPNSPISRQEMAVMMTRAAKAAGVTVTPTNSTSSYLTNFKDKGKIASWAKTDVAKAVFSGVITGKTTTTFSPTTNATRAEAAVMIKRLLEYVDFLDT